MNGSDAVFQTADLMKLCVGFGEYYRHNVVQVPADVLVMATFNGK